MTNTSLVDYSAVWLVAFLGAIIAGLCLEFKDKQYGNVFDWSDVIWTALGGIPGQVLWLLIL